MDTPGKSPATTTERMAGITKEIVRLVVISDTHGQHELFQEQQLLPAGDILLHCGDFANRGSPEDARNFVAWISSLAQYPEKLVIDGNHDRTLNQSGQKAVEGEDAINLPELFATQAHSSVQFLQDQSVTTRDGLVVHGSSWKSCELDSFPLDVMKQNLDVWMVHRHPFIDKVSVLPGDTSNDVSNIHWKGWMGSRSITQIVKDYHIPLCLSGHVHFARGMLQPNLGTEASNSNSPPVSLGKRSTFVNAASLWSSRMGIGVSPPVVIDFHVPSRKVVNIEITPHPE